LKTSDRKEAEQIVEAENRALADPVLGQQLAKPTSVLRTPRRLTRENIDEERRLLIYNRAKTGQLCRMQISDDLAGLLKQLPEEGMLFPANSQGDWRYRSAEFARRCRLLGIKGISLHSYRYSWAERALAAGIAERHAMAALGHGSKAVHRAYAKAVGLWKMNFALPIGGTDEARREGCAQNCGKTHCS